MTQAEINEKVAQELELSKKDAGKVVDVVTAVLTEAVCKDGVVRFGKAGSFKLRHRDGGTRKYTFGDKKGQEYTVPETASIFFVASKETKEMLNDSKVIATAKSVNNK